MTKKRTRGGYQPEASAPLPPPPNPREPREAVFFHGGPVSSYWSTFWPHGELRTFRDEEAVRLFCKTKGLTPIFDEEHHE